MTNEIQQAREALGYRLRDIRLDARMSGRQLAALTGWHFTKISKIEHGRLTRVFPPRPSLFRVTLPELVKSPCTALIPGEITDAGFRHGGIRGRRQA